VVLDRLDDVAEQARPDEPGDGGQHVQPDRHGQRSRIAPEQLARVPLHLGRAGHRQRVAAHQ
jgi:hypothetical protein